MRNFINRYTLAAALSSLAMITACDDEEKKVTPVTLQFLVGSVTTSESAAEQTISVPFSSAALASATIEVALTTENATYGEDFVTIPSGSSGTMKLNVTKGQTAAQFKFVPLDNELMNEEAKVTLTLTNPSDALIIGSQSEVTFTLTDDEGPTKVNFTTDQTSLFENEPSGAEVTIQLTSAATGAGTTVIAFTSNGAYGTDFTTEPASVNGKITLQNEVGDETITVKVIPVNDVSVNADIVIDMTIEGAEGGVELGTSLTHTITIKDDETPSNATFTTATGTGYERETSGITVPVTFTPALGNGGTLEVTMSSTDYTYGTDYTTDPAATNGKLTLNVSQGVSETSFKVLPVNNAIENANHVITFSMSASTGVLVIGSTGTTYELTVADDDHVSTLTELRAMYNGSDVVLPVGTNIRATVISKNDNVTARNMYIQDATAGMLIRFNSNNTFTVSDDVQIDVSGATLTSFNGNLQVTSLANANAVKKGTAALPAYQVVTVSEFNNNLNAYESELVQIDNVGFTQADGTTTMSGSRTASDGTTQFTVRSESYSPWGATAIPYGMGTIRGVATEFNGASQVVPQVYADDISVSVGTKAITITQAITDFGSIQKGQTSTSKQYTVQGTDLTNDVTISASTSFELSKNNTDFSSSITFTAAEVSSSQTVYVRFAPNTGTDQTINGSIKHTSLGAETKTFSVSGTEFGNVGGASRLINEGFEYTSGTLLTDNGYLNSSGTSNFLTVGTGNGLSITGYPLSGGNGIAMKNTGQDVYKTFTSQNSGDVYISFLINVSQALTGDYILGMSQDGLQTSYYDRVFLKSSGSGYVFGMLKTSQSGVTPTTYWGTTELALNTTYLVVVKYSFVAGDLNDTISLFVFADGNVPGSEPASGEINKITDITNDAANLASFTLRQGSSTAAPTLTIDGIRVAKLWADLFN